MFALGQIVLSAVVGAAASAISLFILRARTRGGGDGGGSRWPLSVVVGLSILAWRAAGNTPVLNEDPIAFVSPNDVLCPVVTYVSLGVYAGLRGMSGGPDWMRIRALLTIVSAIVNVVTI